MKKFTLNTIGTIGLVSMAIASHNASAACTYTVTNNWGSGFTGGN